MKVYESPIVKEGIKFPKYTAEIVPFIMVHKHDDPTLFEIVTRLLKLSKVTIIIVYNFIKILTWWKMSNSKTTKLGNRKFIAMIVGVIFMIAAALGLDLEALGITEIQIVELIIGLIAVVTALFIDRKQAEESADAE